MAGIAHLSVGLAAKRVAPKAPVGVLIVAAYSIDIIWGVFFLAGLETYPTPGQVSVSPYSHGLFMAILWSLAAGLLAGLLTRSKRNAVLIGLLVFSHWLVDFMVKPMTAAFPGDSGLTLFFDPAQQIGLGLYRTQWGINLGEYGGLLLGAGIYVWTLIHNRSEKAHPKAIPV